MVGRHSMRFGGGYRAGSNCNRVGAQHELGAEYKRAAIAKARSAHTALLGAG